MKILVLGGCGAMGTEATRDLVATSEFEEIAVADVDLGRAQALCDDPRMKALQVDVTDAVTLPRVMESYDVILNCTSYNFGLGITEAAIQARRPLLDLGGLMNTPKQLAMDDRAREAGVTIVLGMGATPGVTNLMARAGAQRMDQVEEFHVAFATWRAIAPSPGLLDTVLDEFSPDTTRFYYEDGRLVEAPPFAGECEIEFAPPIGRVKTYYVPHSETHALPRSFPGVKRVDVRGTWRPETMVLLKQWGEQGLLSTTPIPVDGGQHLAPKRMLRSLLLSRSHLPDTGEWAFYVHVDVVGRKGDARVTATYNLSHPPTSEWGQTATAKVTGIPASIGAQKVARGQVTRTGVLTPENAFEPHEFFADLAKRRILVDEQVLETRRLGALEPAGHTK